MLRIYHKSILCEIRVFLMVVRFSSFGLNPLKLVIFTVVPNSRIDVRTVQRTSLCACTTSKRTSLKSIFRVEACRTVHNFKYRGGVCNNDNAQVELRYSVQQHAMDATLAPYKIPENKALLCFCYVNFNHIPAKPTSK